MEILALLSLLQIKHWYADFKIQTYMQTVRKGIYRDLIGISHSLDHTWTSMVVLLVFSLFVSPIHPALIVVVPMLEGIAHYHIDWTKVKYGCKDNTKPLFWNQFGLDQLAHQLTYIIMIYVVLL
jgi:hypothetical protein